MSLTPDHYWLAGLVEGEGSFAAQWRDGWLSVEVRVASTDRDVIERCHAIAGGRVNGPYTRDGRKAHWRWYVCRTDEAVALIRLLFPLMGLRRQEQMRACLEAFEARTTMKNREKTRCRHGHPLAGANLRRLPDGSRECRTCRNETSKRWRRRHGEKVA